MRVRSTYVCVHVCACELNLWLGVLVRFDECYAVGCERYVLLDTIIVLNEDRLGFHIDPYDLT